MPSERDTESAEEESTAPKPAVMMERAEEKQEEERSINDQHEGTVSIKNVVIFSDSMAKYTQQYLSSHEFSYRVVAQRGAQIHDVTHNVKEFSTSDLDNPTNATIDVVVLHVGTNNLCNHQTLDQNIQDYEELLQSAVSRFPNAGILVSGILPRFDSKVLNDAAKMYNILLAQLSHTFPDKVKFVDLGSHFRTDRFFAIDGLHLSYQGNPRFAAKLQEAVEYHFSTDPEHVRWKEAFSAAVQKVPFPKPSLLGPVSSGKVEKASQRDVKPRVPVTRKGFKSLRQKVKESTRSRRKCGPPKQEKKCSDVSNWTGWTRCQGPTSSCSPSGNGPKWKTEYLIRTNCCLYKRLQKAPHSHQPEYNTKRGKKRKMPGPAKVDPNPKDLDKLEELLEECADQSALWRNPGPIPRKRKRQCSGKGELLQDRKNKDHRVQQKDINPQPTNDGHNTADLHDDICPSYPVYIQMWDGQLLTGDIADDSTIKELHETVAKFYQNGLPKEASFYRGGLKVTEEMPLKHQGIVAESTVQVLLKLKGGGDKGDAEAKAVRHMTQWTVEETVQWMQTEAKMRPDEVKPLVEEQVDGLALWEMTVDSLKKHFTCLSGGAKIKLLKALKSYRKMSPDFEQIILPDKLPSNVTSWREKDIRLWLSCVVKFTQNDIDSVCALDLDGDSLLTLDEETVRELEFLPEMKQGPLVKLFSCLKKLNHLLSKRNLEVEDVMGGKEAEIPLISVETSLNKAAANISESMAESIVGAAGDTKTAKATKAFVGSDNENESLVGDKSTADKDEITIKDEVDIKDELVKAIDQDVLREKRIDTKRTSLDTPDTDKEPTPAPSDEQVSQQEPAQAQSSSKAVKLTEKETTILQLLRSSGLNLYTESQCTELPQQCEISRIYARPKTKTELDQLFNFLVIRKATVNRPPQSQVSEFTKHLWSKIRKELCHWMDFLPNKYRKDYHVDQTVTSSENVFRSKDKAIISLSKKDPTFVPLGQIDIQLLKSIKTATTIFIVEESLTTEEPQEYITTCGAKDRQYYFQYCKNDNWHATFDERNLMKGFVLNKNVMTAKSNLLPLEKKPIPDEESPSVPPESPKGTVSANKTPTESNEAVRDICATDLNLLEPSKTAEQDSVNSINTKTLNGQHVKTGSNVGANQSSIMDEEQVSCTDERSDLGTSQKLPSESQRPFPFGKNDIGKFSYKRGDVLTVMESGAGSLLSPCHEFKVYQWVKSTDQKISSGAKEYFIFETLRFVTGCINARRNGTIHFGIGDDVGGKYQHGEIVGTGLQEHLKAKFDDMIKESIHTYFKHDWAISAVNQCIYPVRFIPVDLEESEPSVRKYVIEVDVAPTFALTQNRAFFIEFRKMKIHKMQPGERLFFRERSSTVHYTGSKLDDFQHNLLQKLVQERKELDQKNNSTIERPSYNNEYNAKKLKSCLLGGETDLKAKYPILFVSKTDSQTRGIESELGFIAEIPWIAIFDLDPNSDHSGICKLFRSQMKHECLLYRPEEKFLHFSDHEELAEAILFPEKTCWIFANGRHALGVDPCDDKKWTGTERCKAVKNAISFFSRPDKIPPGKAVVVFLVLSEDIDIMVSCFRNCFEDFCGIDNFLCLFENKNAYESWKNQVGSVCGPGELQRKSIVGMPWAHINQTVQSINGLKVQTEPLIPTSSGSYDSLTNQQRNKLDDLEVLSKNQCEDLRLDPKSEDFEEFCQEKEMMFYKGNEVDWLNFFLTDVYSKNHVMERENKFRELHKLVSASLYQRDPHLKGKTVIITLYYQAGSGATTLGRHILWKFRDSNVRCCVIMRITEGTANQILTLRRYLEKDENECLPVLVLIDNKNEELVQNLIAGIERQIKEKGIVTEKPVCIILQCKRTPDAKKLHDDNPSKSEYLEQSVSDNEMIWLEKKQEELEKKQENLSSDSGSDTEYAEDADEPMTQSENSLIRTPLNLDKNPDRFIKFMILRKNFDPEFVRNFVANSLTEIKGNEQLLLRYTALLNVFVEKEDSFVPLHCAEALMGINENKYRTMDNTLSRAVKVFLIVVERYTCGKVEGYKIVDPLLASEVLKHIVAENETYSSIACDFLESRLFCNTYTTKELIFFTKEMLKRRKKFAYGDETETQFSLLIEHICYEEGHNNAAAVLQKGLKLDKFVDPIIAQTLARLFLRHDDFAQAHEYAGIAVDHDSNNSYLLVTAGKVYHEEMIRKFDRTDSGLTLSMLQDALFLAMSAVEQYSKSKEANRTGRYPPNMHCYLEEIKLCFKLLFIIRRVDPFKGRDGQAKLQRYLTDPNFVPDEVQGVWKKYQEWIKSLKGRMDASIDRLDKDFRYNKPKSRDKEHERFKKKFYEQVRNYNSFFGSLENAIIGSDEESKRLQACNVLEGHKVNFSLAFEYIKGKGKNAVPNLERAMDHLMRISEREAFDLEGLISVSLALSTVDPHSKKIPSFKQVYEWCVELSTLAPSTLEPHLFLTMFLWPREDMDIDFDAGSFKNSKDRLSNLHKEQCPSHVFRHFQAHKRMTITGYSRPMPPTNFFLSTGKGLQSFVLSQRNFDGEQFWERTEVQAKLRRLEGICLNDNTISYQVKDFPRIEIHSSRTIAIKGASEEVVSFFLGFSWEGPIAYNVKVQ